MKLGKPTIGSTKSSHIDCVKELKSMLRDKEMVITDLQLETKMANNKLEQLESTLRRKDEETYQIKRNQDYLEKMIKTKAIDWQQTKGLKPTTIRANKQTIMFTW